MLALGAALLAVCTGLPAMAADTFRFALIDGGEIAGTLGSNVKPESLRIAGAIEAMLP